MKKEKSITIFIVDDNKVISLAVEDMLKVSFDEYDVTVLKFETGEKCLAALNETTPDVIILDYHLDSNILAMNGMNVLTQVKLKNKNIEVIMLSGQDKLEIAVDCIKYGARDYVVKNESAFVRIKQIIKIIAENNELKKDLKKYSMWNFVFGCAFVIVALALGVVVSFACSNHFK